MFDKNKFKKYIELAIGERTITEFSQLSGVNRTYLSKYLNCKLDSPPTPEILKKIASSTGAVVYEDLMKAAGHLESEPGLVGKRLIYLREQKEMSQDEVANQLSIDIEQYKLFELNHRLPEYAILQKFADFYGVSVNFIISLDDMPFCKNDSVCEKRATYNIEDKDTQAIVNEVLEREDLKDLIRSTRGVPTEQIRKAIEVIEIFKKK